jgi:Bacterial membrane protein YfhO
MALLVAGALALVAWKKPRALGWVAVAGLMAQGAWCARGLIETLPRADLAQTPNLLSAVKAAGGERTRLAAWPERYQYKGDRFAATAAARRGDFESISPDHNMRFGVGNIFHYLPGAAGELERACSVRPQCTSSCARRLGAGLCIVSPDPARRMVERGAVELARSSQPELVLLRDPAARPWASVPGVRRLEVGEDLKKRFIEADAGAVALQREAPREYDAEPEAVTRWQRVAPGEARIEVTLKADNVLVLAEHCAPGWTAHVDDEAVEVARVDGGLCAVEVKAGQHVVQMRYVPPGWPWVWGVFAAGLVGCAFIGLRALWGKKGWVKVAA